MENQHKCKTNTQQVHTIQEKRHEIERIKKAQPKIEEN